MSGDLDLGSTSNLGGTLSRLLAYRDIIDTIMFYPFQALSILLVLILSLSISWSQRIPSEFDNFFDDDEPLTGSRRGEQQSRTTTPVPILQQINE